jgi:glycerate kinase
MALRIAVAPNAFRGSLTAQEAVEAITEGLLRSALDSPEIVPMPLADGGDGTLDTLIGLTGEKVTRRVIGPLGSPVEAQFGLMSDGRSAVIEMARASGVELISPADRNPLITTSYGTGELIREALKLGRSHILLGVGGSATVDGGAGCLSALKIRLLDSVDQPIPAGGLAKLARIDASQCDPTLRITVLCDVENPLLGEHGAARVFGPQKGATPEGVEILEANLTHFADVIQHDLGVDVRDLPRGGAAGGIAAGLAACFKAVLVPGGPTIIDLLGYTDRLRGCDLLITGEGKLDSQTEGGKAVQSIAHLAHAVGIPVIAFTGMLHADRDSLRKMGIAAAWSILPEPCSLDKALHNARAWLTRTATQLGDTLTLPGSVR